MTTRKRISAIAALTIAMAAVIAPSAQAASPRYITVTSPGAVKVVPDAVRINATATNVGATSKEALTSTAKTSAAVRAALLAAKSAARTAAELFDVAASASLLVAPTLVAVALI